jgi:putative PIN family toxin of toxin-antitoxin system
MRVVVDTNILVSFAIQPSEYFATLFDYLAVNGVTLISEDTIGELFAVLSRDKFRQYVSQNSAIDYVEWYAGISESVVITEQVIACRDPKDDKFLALAMAGQADCIISGDRDLLDMITYGGVPIHSAADFLRLFVSR